MEYPWNTTSEMKFREQMPWTKKDYPDSMKDLPVVVRNKAIEIGNALIEEEYLEEGIAITTAIRRAKDWAAERGEKTEKVERFKISNEAETGKDKRLKNKKTSGR
jgi:uncharacterized protein YdaT